MNTIHSTHEKKESQQLALMTDQDVKRVLTCLESDSLEMPIVEQWEEKIERSRIISQSEAPPDLVTIHSTIQCREDPSKNSDLEKIGNLSIVFPHEANIDEGKISIMAPLGIALVGARLGQTISWRCRNGRVRSLVIESICYQPEASGHWHL